MLRKFTATTLIIRASGDGDIIRATSETRVLAIATYNVDILIWAPLAGLETSSDLMM